MIPSVYQSPERFDTRTNYLVPVGTSTAFFGKQGSIPRRWEDGVNNTVILVEANDELATEWTRPSDLHVDVKKPRAGLGGLRQDGFFVLWGGGRLRRIDAHERVNNLKANVYGRRRRIAGVPIHQPSCRGNGVDEFHGGKNPHRQPTPTHRPDQIKLNLPPR